MKSKSSSAQLKMPDSEIRVGLEAAKKPLHKEIKANQGPKLKEPMSNPRAQDFRAKDEARMMKKKNIPKRKK